MVKVLSKKDLKLVLGWRFLLAVAPLAMLFAFPILNGLSAYNGRVAAVTVAVLFIVFVLLSLALLIARGLVAVATGVHVDSELIRSGGLWVLRHLSSSSRPNHKQIKRSSLKPLAAILAVLGLWLVVVVAVVFSVPHTRYLATCSGDQHMRQMHHAGCLRLEAQIR